MDTMSNQVDIWGNTALAAMSALWAEVAAFLPNLLGAALILAVGWLVARAADALVTRLLAKLGVDRLSGGVGINATLERANISMPPSGLLGRLVFWLLLLTFVVSATEALGLDRVSATIDALVQYIPKVLGAAVILLLGLLLAGVVRNLVTGAAAGVGFEQAESLGRVVHGLMVIVVLVLAVGQLELETDILYTVISIGLAAVATATALAFGLGAREVAANILAGSYLRDQLPAGRRVRIGAVEGDVVQVGPVSTVLRTVAGDEVGIANRRVLNRDVHLLPDQVDEA